MNGRSAIWGGATLGLIVGAVLGFFVGSFWTTLLYAVLAGASIGVVAELLGQVSDALRRRFLDSIALDPSQDTTLVATLFAVVATVVMAANFLGGTIAVIWLAILRDWADIGIGIAAGTLMPWGYTIVTLPAMGLGFAVAALAHSRARLLACPLGFLVSLYNNAAVAAWVIGVFAFAVAKAEGRPSPPYLLWAYTTTMAPLSYMARHEPPDSYGTSMGLLFAVLCYLISVLWFFFGGAGPRLWLLYAVIAIGTGFSLLGAALMLSRMIAEGRAARR